MKEHTEIGESYILPCPFKLFVRHERNQVLYVESKGTSLEHQVWSYAQKQIGSHWYRGRKDREEDGAAR